jgi:hypothetical protein
MVIHEPSFHHALAHGLVPSYLLLAVCAVAAPLSQRSSFKEGGSRFSGEVFFQEAMSLMFDKDQNLVCEKTLATAQALCLMQLHDRMAKSSWRGRYHGSEIAILVLLMLMLLLLFQNMRSKFSNSWAFTRLITQS